MLQRFLFSLQKTRLLLKIAKCKSQRHSDKIYEQAYMSLGMGTFDSKSSKYNLYVEKLFSLLATNKEFNIVLQYYDRDFEDLKKIIESLELYGARQLIKGNPVSVAAIAFLPSLQFILEHWNGESFEINGLDNYNSGLQISHDLIKYFEK